jgi:hypothetical protein
LALNALYIIHSVTYQLVDPDWVCIFEGLLEDEHRLSRGAMAPGIAAATFVFVSRNVVGYVKLIGDVVQQVSTDPTAP